MANVLSGKNYVLAKRDGDNAVRMWILPVGGDYSLTDNGVRHGEFCSFLQGKKEAEELADELYRNEQGLTAQMARDLRSTTTSYRSWLAHEGNHD